ncbi:MAG: methylmalonyl-CoA mutase family protein [Aigarchaeota archaeon]|nr:methylmalonyl-CoA mutase family protein [Aigarchaeota archaeon]
MSKKAEAGSGSSDKTLTSDSGIPVKSFYGEGDAKPLSAEDVPGQFPFTRGIYPDMYRFRLWTMRQYSGFGSAEETNERFKLLMKEGQTGLSIAFDLPTQLGYDSDGPRVYGEVGRTGVAISTLKDMETLFDGISLDKVSTSMTINSTAPIILAMYVALAEKQGVPFTSLRGTVQNDVLKEYVARNTYIFPPGPSMKLAVDLIEYCTQNVPNWYSISISGYHMREAGCNAIQEVAFTLANAAEYVKAVLERGMKVDEFAPRLSFFFACGNDFFEEIAKFRAARRLWAKMMKERFQAKDSKSMMLRFHTQTSGATLTAQQPLNNIARVTMQALAATLGGTQSLHTCSFDEALSLPTEQAVITALRTQQLIAYESGVPRAVDPLGGSVYVEYVTGKIEEEAQKEIEKIDEMGGAVAAIESGYMRRKIHDSAYRHQTELDAGAKIAVGVNKFTAEEKIKVQPLKVSTKAVKQQLERLRNVKETRDPEKVKHALREIEKAARTGDNVMSAIVEAVKVYATTGEITEALRSVYGAYKPATAY